MINTSEMNDEATPTKCDIYCLRCGNFIQTVETPTTLELLKNCSKGCDPINAGREWVSHNFCGLSMRV